MDPITQQLSNFALKLITAVSTTNGPVEIGFYHRYNTEPFWDGGVVEYSINGGSTWINATSFFTENGPPTYIASNSGTSLAVKRLSPVIVIVNLIPQHLSTAPFDFS
jgi:hypothetical protein